MDKQPVLIVEDEPLLQHLLKDVLEEAGFAVTVSEGADEAIHQLEQPNCAYVALVTDINVAHPTRTGWDIARRARELDGAIPVIYTTGTAAAEWASQGVPNSVLVTKPFAPAQVVTAISQLLNATSAPGPSSA